ncbi:MAG: alpha/beta hydrolase [Thiohalocapsa sp.]|nr:alpha/beta hydrolase [Thiohalocapsa sp.]MCF7990028.1 alpha/beta hydrolase [Thiohalocapsa sp.]
MQKSNAVQDFVLQQMTAPARLALEARAGWEMGALLAAQPVLAMAPKGDGHPVMVLPLMFGGDLSTGPLRAFLDARGYHAQPWDLGLNLGPRDGVFASCLERLSALSDRHGRKVSLVGWSLGGLYARALAKAAPGQVRCVITLGTPIGGFPKPGDLWRMAEMATGTKMGMPASLGPVEEPPPVPLTSIYSRSDGIVHWRCSVVTAAPRTENVEVESSHLGLGVNPLALYAIADRLALPEDDWRPFERSGVKAWLYRDPGRRGWL